MILTALFLLHLAGQPPAPSQKAKETLLGAVIMRTIDGKTSAELFPIAVIRNGKYTSANSSAMDEPPKPCALKKGSSFTLYKNGFPVGNMNVSKVVTRENAIGAYRLGLGDWRVEPENYPSKTYTGGEEDLAACMYFSMDTNGVEAPARVLLALNGQTAKKRAWQPYNPKELKAVLAAMKPVVDAQAKKFKIDASRLKLQSLGSYDVDGDGKKEYAALFMDTSTDNPDNAVSLVGSLNGTKLDLLYLSPDANVYPEAFDALDIDGDGKKEIIFKAGVYEGCGFLILSKVGGKFKKVFQEIEFGV